MTEHENIVFNGNIYLFCAETLWFLIRKHPVNIVCEEAYR